MDANRVMEQAEALASELAQFHGFRTLWIDPRGQLSHSEPDEELETFGYTYVTTVLRPQSDDLAVALRSHAAPVAAIAVERAVPAAGFVPAPA